MRATEFRHEEKPAGLEILADHCESSSQLLRRWTELSVEMIAAEHLAAVNEDAAAERRASGAERSMRLLCGRRLAGMSKFAREHRESVVDRIREEESPNDEGGARLLEWIGRSAKSEVRLEKRSAGLLDGLRNDEDSLTEKWREISALDVALKDAATLSEGLIAAFKRWRRRRRMTTSNIKLVDYKSVDFEKAPLFKPGTNFDDVYRVVSRVYDLASWAFTATAADQDQETTSGFSSARRKDGSTRHTMGYSRTTIRKDDKLNTGFLGFGGFKAANFVRATKEMDGVAKQLNALLEKGGSRRIGGEALHGQAELARKTANRLQRVLNRIFDVSERISKADVRGSAAKAVLTRYETGLARLVAKLVDFQIKCVEWEEETRREVVAAMRRKGE